MGRCLLSGYDRQDREEARSLIKEERK